MTENLVGKTLADRYHILELIGTGGMASVYKAQCELLKRDVAVKVLRDSVKDDELALRSFKQEAQAAAKLSHPNIVQVFDVGEIDGMDYIVMELVEGVTLKKHIKENGALPWQEACELAVQIAQALEAAHAKEVVHRDIKPQNILVTEDKVLKVADFGIAKAASSETMIVGDNNAMGSAHYISPEQARGGFTDARSDIYSLGVVLFEMLTGRVPFDGESAVAVALMHIEKKPPSVLDFNPSVPTDVAKIVMKAMAKEQSGRYQSATEMIADINDALENKPVEVVVPVETEDEIEATKRFNISEVEANKVQKTKKKKTAAEKKADITATILALVTVVVLLLSGYGVWSFVTREPVKIEVPDFVEMSREDALRIANERGLLINEIKTDVSDDIPKDHVMWQDPVAGTEVEESETVFIIVSEGSSKGDIAVPNVSDMPIDYAMRILDETGLAYEIKDRESEEVPRDYVITQSPVEGTKVSEGYKVTLLVSVGTPVESRFPVSEEKLIVPSLLGKTKSEAEEICQQYDFTLSAIEMDDSRPRNEVIQQEPQAGAEADAGSLITVVVSSGKANSEDEQMKTKEYTFEIPEGTGSVNVKITVDGDTEYERVNNWGDTVSIDVSGVGRKKVVVFLNGRIYDQEYIEFD